MLSDKAVQLQETSPLYPVPDPEGKADSDPTGPDDDNSKRSIDREKEELQRFLNEMERLAEVNLQARTQGEVTFDFFDRLNRESPYIPPTYNAILAQALPLLRRETHRVEIIVWAKNPGPVAVRLALVQAANVRDELINIAALETQHQKRLRAVGRPWAYSDHKRPIMSIVMRKVQVK